MLTTARRNTRGEGSTRGESEKFAESNVGREVLDRGTSTAGSLLTWWGEDVGLM